MSSGPNLQMCARSCTDIFFSPSGHHAQSLPRGAPAPDVGKPPALQSGKCTLLANPAVSAALTICRSHTHYGLQALCFLKDTPIIPHVGHLRCGAVDARVRRGYDLKPHAHACCTQGPMASEQKSEKLYVTFKPRPSKSCWSLA